MANPLNAPPEKMHIPRRKESNRKRPKVGMMASAVFILIGVAALSSGAILEGAGALLVALCCSCIGIDPTKRTRSA